MSGTELSPEALALLHEARLRGFVERGADPLVDGLRERGSVMCTDSRVTLTPEGRVEHAAWARVPAGSEAEGSIARGYERFLTLNVELLRVCTNWQVRFGNVMNDHSDPVYDWGVVDRLVAFDERAGPIVRGFGETLPRLASYRPRLRSAATQVRDGSYEWFLSPSRDSFHTVWMQLHEDLLLALGRDRVAEEQAP